MTLPTALIAMAPEHALLAGVVLLLVLRISGRGQRAALGLALLSVAAAALCAALLAQQGYAAVAFPGHLSVSTPVLLAKTLLLVLALPVLLMAQGEFDGDEFPVLLLSSLYGACLLPSADSFLTLLLGLEIMSLPLYVLVLLAWRRPQAAEAALKYLVLGGTATAMLLMGASLLYGATGSLAIEGFATALASGDTLARTAAVLIVAALFLKAAIAPFHGWAPDAYEAASVPVTAFMASVVKAAVLLAAWRLFGGATLASPMVELVALLPLTSIVWGNLAAMRQTSLRRLLAYSSIAHAGYLFLVFLGEPALRTQALVFYLLAYGLMNLLALAALPAHADDMQRDRLGGPGQAGGQAGNLQGLYQRAPVAALLIAIAMLSLAGLPPLPGFIAKFLIFKNLIAAGHVGYAVAGLVASFLGLYAYLRVIQVMFMAGPASSTAQASPRGLARVATLACVIGALVLALAPGWALLRM